MRPLLLGISTPPERGEIYQFDLDYERPLGVVMTTKGHHNCRRDCLIVEIVPAAQYRKRSSECLLHSYCAALLAGKATGLPENYIALCDSIHTRAWGWLQGAPHGENGKALGKVSESILEQITHQIGDLIGRPDSSHILHKPDCWLQKQQ